MNVVTMITRPQLCKEAKYEVGEDASHDFVMYSQLDITIIENMQNDAENDVPRVRYSCILLFAVAIRILF